jgi:hypothetical protein
MAKSLGQPPKPVTTLDDGHFRTAIRIPFEGGCPEAYLRQHAHDELWIRWLRDALLGIPLRDVVSDGKVLPAAKLLPIIIARAALPLAEHVYPVFSAVMNQLWPPEAAKWLSQAPRLTEANGLIKQALAHASSYQGFEYLRQVDLRLL